ncbi:MAG: BatA domain-containing protein [Kiritimatiellia bacterium]
MLSPLFLWLIPLALLPVIIHLLNRLRYQTVPWAAMMFLRSADRDASRRAKLRQWLILAARCLMLLMFLLALARLQSRGRLARFFDPGSNLVVILFDRSASMEQLRGGIPGRERALKLLNQGLSELGPGARVLWMDSVSGELTPIPNGIELDRLPMASASETSSDLSAMLRGALQEIARAGVNKAEIWIPTDRQTSAWLPEGANPPDWGEWKGLNTEITLRLLDVAQVPPDAGNRSLQLAGPPRWDGENLTVPLRLLRETDTPESVPLVIRSGGLSLREDLMVEGTAFSWEQILTVPVNEEELHAEIFLPADSNPADNRIAVSWRDSGPARALIDSADPLVARVFRAALLPREGFRELVSPGRAPDSEVHLLLREGFTPLLPADRSWVEQGGILLQIPFASDLVPLGEEGQGVGVADWQEKSGVLATEQREPLRMDLVRVFARASLPSAGTSLATLEEEGEALLTVENLGKGKIYRLATLPVPGASNLDAGYVLVPVLQRMLTEGANRMRRAGTHRLGAVELGDPGQWSPLGDPEADPLLNTGLFQDGEGVLALNRPESEDRSETLTFSELQAWAEPLDLRIFEDRTKSDRPVNRRFEFSSLLSLLGLLFLVIESWLLTRNIRPAAPAASPWRVRS